MARYAKRRVAGQKAGGSIPAPGRQCSETRQEQTENERRMESAQRRRKKDGKGSQGWRKKPTRSRGGEDAGLKKEEGECRSSAEAAAAICFLLLPCRYWRTDPPLVRASATCRWDNVFALPRRLFCLPEFHLEVLLSRTGNRTLGLPTGVSMFSTMRHCVLVFGVELLVAIEWHRFLRSWLNAEPRLLVSRDRQ